MSTSVTGNFTTGVGQNGTPTSTLTGSVTILSTPGLAVRQVDINTCTCPAGQTPAASLTETDTSDANKAFSSVQFTMSASMYVLAIMYAAMLGFLVV